MNRLSEIFSVSYRVDVVIIGAVNDSVFAKSIQDALKLLLLHTFALQHVANIILVDKPIAFAEFAHY